MQNPMHQRTQDRPQTVPLPKTPKLHRISVEIPRRTLLVKRALEKILREDGYILGRLTYPQIIEVGLECIARKYGITEDQINQMIQFLESQSQDLE